MKFSPPGDSPADRRWKDLLIAEYVALRTIREAGRNASLSQLIEGENRIFLEVTRFDRVALRGRIGVVSLSSFDAEHFGNEDNWVSAASRLTQASHISANESDQIRFLATFGRMIGNTDMHFGNLSLIVEEGNYRLSPSYDMVPMLYAPINGQLIERDLRTYAAGPHPDALNVWPRAASAAIDFWRSVAVHPSVSADFKAIARLNLAHVQSFASGN